jgi:hypothetical protein
MGKRIDGLGKENLPLDQHCAYDHEKRRDGHLAPQHKR